MTTVWTGAEELRPMLMPIETLTPAPFNVRQGDIPTIADSLRRFGQLKPIVLNRDGEIVAGNNVTRAAIEMLGWTHLAAVTADTLEGPDQLLFLLADNLTSDNARTNPEAAQQVQAYLMQQADGADDEYRALYTAAAEALARSAARATPPEFQVIDPDGLAVEFECPGCHYEWSGGQVA